MKARVLLWVTPGSGASPCEPTVIAWVGEPMAEGLTPPDRPPSGPPYIANALQKWLDKGWRFAPGFSAPCTVTAITTVFLEIDVAPETDG